MIPAAITIPGGSGEPSPSPRSPTSPKSPKSPNRKFSFYASRLHDSGSPVPADAYASPLPSPSILQQTISLPPSPSVHIVPFGFAYRNVASESSESLPLSQLPPLPMSPMLPMSPRWDSLSHSSKFALQPTPENPNPASLMDAPPHPPSPFAYDAYSIPSDSRNASPTFALATHSSLGDLHASDNPSASSPIENFSRPRKLSIRQPITNPAKPRPTGSFNPADQYLELVSSPTQNPLWPPTRPRGPSVSSCQSASTNHSVLSPPASEFNEPRPPRSRPTTNSTAPLQRPPLTYNNTGGSASPSAVAAPWMGGEELRSSFRSQFTESTAPGTTATERSSVLTKDSSVTSLYPTAEADVEDDGQGEADVDDDDDELSLDDLMGMYEQGFDDDEDLDNHYHEEDRPDTSASQIDYHAGARPETAASYNIGSRPATSTSNRDYSISARPETSASIDYQVDGRPDASASHIDYNIGARPETAASDVDYNIGARPGSSTSSQGYNVGARPETSTSSQGYKVGARPDTSNSDRFSDMGAHPTTSASDMEPRHGSIQIQIDDDDEDFPQRGTTEKEKTSTLDREIRMSKMIFTSPAYIASVPHIAENLARRSMDKRDSAKSLDSEPSVVSSRTPLNETAPPFSPSINEIFSPISPPISPPNDDINLSLSLPFTAKAAPSSLISPPVSPPPPVPSNMAPPIAAAPPEDPSCRDRYGFKKENQYVSRQQYDTWNSGYTEYLARRRKKWVAYLKDSALMTDHPNRFPAPNAKTKRFVRKGIPPDWRGAAWFYYAGGPAILAQHSGLYDKLTTKKANEVDTEAIERDLHRTFPDNVKFKPPGGFQAATASARESQSTMTDDSVRGHSPVPPPGSEDEPPIITSLRRVLHAFSVYNPRIGYCQSLNFLAGLLLLFVETEEQCFWLLNVITRIYLPGTHETSLEGSKVDLGVLMTELRDTMPGIWDKVGGDLEAEPNSRPQTSKSIRLPRSRRKDLNRLSTDRLPPITLCMTAWFMSCFIGTLPIESTLRVWDVFFYEGSKTLFRISLAIFKLGESEIKSVSDPMEMFGVVQGFPRKLIDANGLMDACFKRRNGFGHLSQDQIDVRRQERRAKAQFDRAQQNKVTKTWNVTQSDPAKEKEKGLFGKKRTPTGM